MKRQIPRLHRNILKAVPGDSRPSLHAGTWELGRHHWERGGSGDSTMGTQEVLDREKELAGLGARGQPPVKAKEGGSERDKAGEGSRRRPQTKARADPGCGGRTPLPRPRGQQRKRRQNSVQARASQEERPWDCCLTFKISASGRKPAHGCGHRVRVYRLGPRKDAESH